MRHIKELTDCLLREMELQKNFPDGEQIETIYFGGGTPSLLRENEVARLLTGIKNLFKTAEEMEITMEANPENISAEYIEQVMLAGVNRVSLGIQSFDDKCLAYLGRSHDYKSAKKALDLLLAYGVPEVTADLIFGIPGQTDDSLLHDLLILTASKVPHISVYALTVEEKTPLRQFIAKGKSQKPDEEQQASQFEIIMKTLESLGYEQYEISNYCLPGHRSKHNSSYWNGTQYLGLGPSAHSFNKISRQWNVSNISEYMSAVRENRLLFESEVLTGIERFNEYLMTALRTIEGIDLDFAANEFDAERMGEIGNNAEKYVLCGWLIKEANRIRLTRQGKLFADRIASELFRQE